jgi:hypothetical protein
MKMFKNKKNINNFAASKLSLCKGRWMKQLKEDSMKKLLVLALVLSMATMANAGLQFVTSNGVTEVNPSTVVTINLVTTQGTTISGFGWDAVQGLGEASNGLISSNFGSQMGGNVYNPATGIILGGTYASDVHTPIQYSGGTVYSFQLHIPSLPFSSIITVNTYADGDNYLDAYYFASGVGEVDGNFTGLTLHVIPEPMTMGLLGLGGLFLRRRSK